MINAYIIRCFWFNAKFKSMFSIYCLSSASLLWLSAVLRFPPIKSLISHPNLPSQSEERAVIFSQSKTLWDSPNCLRHYYYRQDSSFSEQQFSKNGKVIKNNGLKSVKSQPKLGTSTRCIFVLKSVVIEAFCYWKTS